MNDEEVGERRVVCRHVIVMNCGMLAFDSDSDSDGVTIIDGINGDDDDGGVRGCRII